MCIGDSRSSLHLRVADSSVDLCMHDENCTLCRVGKELSGPLVATLAGLLFSNLGIIGGSNAAGVYSVVNSYILPLAIPLLLFSADLR